MAQSFPVSLDLPGGHLPVHVSVSGGSSPVLAQLLQQRIQAAIGPEYGALADLLDQVQDEAREAGLSIPSTAWQAVCDDHLLDLLRTDHVAEGLHLLRTRVVSAALQNMRVTARLQLDDDTIAAPERELVFAA
jgi:siroheme synthase (precorrin-2 oxidase/ferrochelatase)